MVCDLFDHDGINSTLHPKTLDARDQPHRNDHCGTYNRCDAVNRLLSQYEAEAEAEVEAVALARKSEDEDVALMESTSMEMLRESHQKRINDLRLGDAYMALTQGRKTWEDTVCLSQNGSVESGHYRLDVALKKDVRLDNTSAMTLLQSLMLKDQHLPRIIKEIAQRLFAALFYFELTSIPIRSGTRHHVEEQILCKRKAGDPALCQIVRRLGSSTILIDGKAVRETPIQDIHHNINLQLSFVANESVSIHLKESHTGHSFPLSGAPYNLSRQVARGGLAASFGTSTHKRGGSELYGRPARRRRNR